MTSVPRVALFCETFHEINGVALTARQLVAYASRHDFPMLAIHGGLQPGEQEERSVRRVEVKRGWLSVPIEKDLTYDIFFWRYLSRIRNEVLRFKPDVIHITSPGELGQLGAYLCRRLRIPLVASWHTNFHQFGARRLQQVIALLPKAVVDPTVAWSQDCGLQFLLWFYAKAKVTLAPTQSQVEWLEKELNTPSFLMPRGVDGELFNPNRRTVNDGVLRLGFVGRITPEKGVRLLVEIEKELKKRGIGEFRIVIVGHGSEVDWLRQNMTHAEFPGVLRGEDLARAYANMDLFAFPSRTDTFGNVIQEAAASGVPSVVTNEGGPKDLVIPGVTGYVASSNEEFVEKTAELIQDSGLRKKMGVAAREKVAGVSWDYAFDMTYAAYRYCLPGGAEERSREGKAEMRSARAQSQR
jgi:phosphatidylinositol alpha 1,6-mannosyltransferase